MVVIAPRRLATALALAAVSVALVFARAPGDGARPVPTVAFSGNGLSFRYPAAWRSGTWSDDDVSSFFDPLVYLSTSRMHDPCVVTTSPGEKSIACTYPVGKLPPGGLLVRWQAAGFPDWHLPTPNTGIGGRPSVETKTAGGPWCAPLGGTETITVMIPRDTPDNWFQMDACLRAPGLPQQEAEISAMLSSVRLAKGDLRQGEHPAPLLGYAACCEGAISPAALPTMCFL
jgi:hypothetical protein